MAGNYYAVIKIHPEENENDDNESLNSPDDDNVLQLCKVDEQWTTIWDIDGLMHTFYNTYYKCGKNNKLYVPFPDYEKKGQVITFPNGFDMEYILNEINKWYDFVHYTGSDYIYESEIDFKGRHMNLAEFRGILNMCREQDKVAYPKDREKKLNPDDFGYHISHNGTKYWFYFDPERFEPEYPRQW